MAIHDKQECNCGQPFNENGNCPNCENVFHMDYMVFALTERGNILCATETNYPEMHRDMDAVIVSTQGLPKKWRYMGISEIRERCGNYIIHDPGH